MNETPFLIPRLTGDRFENCKIPLEFLKDLAVLEEMIVEVAKWKYLEDHPTRSRSPRGFTDGISLVLTGLEDGSAKPIINLAVTASTLFPTEPQEYFQHARNAIIDAISAAENNRSPTEYIPEKSLSYFDRMGRSLRDGEAIEFTSDNHPVPVRLTKEVRRRLILAPADIDELTNEVSVFGTVFEGNQQLNTFQVLLNNGRKVCAPIEPQHHDTIVEAFVGFRKRRPVRIQGIGKYDRSDRLREFESIEHISILDDRDIDARLDVLSRLADGWLDGEGVAPDKEGFAWLASVFGDAFPGDLLLPCLYPTPDGGIQAEWMIPPYDISLEIDLGSHTGNWHQLNLDTDAEESKHLVLEQSEDWRWIADRIRAISGGSND